MAATPDEQTPDKRQDWDADEVVRSDRLRRDAARGMSANLEAGLRLSNFALSFHGAARDRAASDSADGK